jgi:outer membrane protein OmpA-like peptidoglycan-associated protein
MVDLDVLFNFKFNTDKKQFVPYFTAGLGGSVYNLNLVLPYGPILGGGLQYNAGKGLFFYSQLIARNGVTDIAKPNFDYSIGVTWALKKKEIKKVEALPIAAPIALDKDSDGIVDSLDKCPSVAGIKKYLGCPIPDTDNDGVNDDDDSCKLVSGLIRYHGCPIPDTDKDGLNDEEDSCKLVAGTLKYHGCPIPDTDKDGVNDEEDACPNEAGIPVNKGCPEIQAKMNELAKSVYFSAGSSVISPKSFPILEEVAALMQRYPKFRIEIEGHTDNVGNPLINKKMSQKRADALKSFFVSKGIDANRLYAIGYGLEKPVATNKTPAGRALNRRVELKAKY